MTRCTQAPTGKATALASRISAMIPAFETERLHLRAPKVEDLPVWSMLLENDSEGHLGGPFTAEEAWEDFCVYVSGWTLHGHGLLAVETHEGRHIGFVHVGLEWGDDEPELGWMILPEYRGQGYATEAARALRDWALDLLGPGAFVSYVAATNAASNALAARLGAVAETGAPYGEDVTLWRYGSVTK